VGAVHEIVGNTGQVSGGTVIMGNLSTGSGIHPKD
jgi:hypothetical protein